jgi:hypothetical protein
MGEFPASISPREKGVEHGEGLRPRRARKNEGAALITPDTAPAQAPPSKLSVEVEAFTPRRSNTLVGFCTVVVPELHLRILDLTVHEKNTSRWVALPSKPWIDRDGVVKRGENGKIIYAPVIEFTDRPTREAFSARVIQSLLEFNPGAFDGEDAA